MSPFSFVHVITQMPDADAVGLLSCPLLSCVASSASGLEECGRARSMRRKEHGSYGRSGIAVKNGSGATGLREMQRLKLSSRSPRPGAVRGTRAARPEGDAAAGVLA